MDRIWLLYQAVENLGIGSLFQNYEMQGARIPRSKAYLAYAAPTRDEAQRRRSRFSTGCYGMYQKLIEFLLLVD